ncbi:MAG: hypothetical protein GOVbin1807_21 [Prokaryotic dsDNA virus sp.]|nr:MAG: hypothetical protein GOVbin1807_21 [Prokaryotic dsDNA virus sp.]|tara:strand:- start:2710 stop:3063 length:354 start_codon:yes stop_codon:yes gene_type:complete
MQKLKIGTLIKDNDKLGVVTKVIEMGTLDVSVDIINWRANYEIHYVDGIVSILGCKTVERLIKENKIEIIYEPTTPLPPSSSSQDILREYMHMQEEKSKNKKGRRKKCAIERTKKDQ